jgi:hypothetical protein
MITYVELMVLAVYAAMAGYIVYLQMELRKVKVHAGFLVDVLHRIARKELKIEEHEDGFSISKRQADREVSVHQHGA